MSALTPNIKTLRALEGTFHRAAEERAERPGKIAPAAPFPDATAARVLGSMAQAFGWAADDLEAEEQALAARLHG